MENPYSNKYRADVAAMLEGVGLDHERDGALWGELVEAVYAYVLGETEQAFTRGVRYGRAHPEQGQRTYPRTAPRGGAQPRRARQ